MRVTGRGVRPPSFPRRQEPRIPCLQNVAEVPPPATGRQNGVAPLRHASEGWHPSARQRTPPATRHGETAYVVAERRTLLSGEYIPVIGRVSRGITGRTGDLHPRLNIPYPTGPTNCSARTRSTGSRRGPTLTGWRGCPTPAVSLRSNWFSWRNSHVRN